MDFFDNLLAVAAIYEQADDLWISQKRTAVGMISAHHDPPGIAHQEIPLEPNGPLQRMHEALVLVLDGGDAAAGFHLGVGAEPLALIDVGEIVTERAVARHASRFAKEDLANIDGQIWMGVDVVGQRSNFAIERVFIRLAAAVAVELD